jgi:hypothetical protein
MPQDRAVSPSQKIQSGNLPGVQNARPAPDTAQESLMIAMGQGYRRLADQLVKGRAADPTEVARALAMVKQANQARKGFGNQGQGATAGENIKAGPGARREVDLGVDPHTRNPINSVPSGGGNQPFVT